MKILYESHEDLSRHNIPPMPEADKLRITPPGVDGPGITPEDLFAVGYAACFEHSLKMVAQHNEFPLQSLTVKAKGNVVEKQEGGYVLDIDLYLTFTGISQEQAETMVTKANELCPYSNAICGNVDVRAHTSVH